MLARRRGLGSASKDGDSSPDITPGPGSRIGRRRRAALDFVTASGGSRREYAAWSCRISPSSLVGGPPSPITELILVELLSMAIPGYRTAPSEARRRAEFLEDP